MRVILSKVEPTVQKTLIALGNTIQTAFLVTPMVLAAFTATAVSDYNIIIIADYNN